MAYGTVSADIIQSSVSGVSLGAGNASIMKNRIINGAMVIDQRNAGAAWGTSINGYSVDRWQCLQSTTGKLNGGQNYNSITLPIGFSNYIGVQSQSAYSVGSGDYYVFRQGIEGFNFSDLNWGTANAKTVTLSFQVYSSLTGTFGGCIANSALNRSYPFNYTISSANTWTSISVTIAGDTTGTWVGATNGVGANVYFGLGVGSSLSGTAGSWAGALYLAPTGATSVVGTNGATFYITGVQLEVGSSATGFEYRQYQQELALCQRYYEVGGTSHCWSGYAVNANNYFVTQKFSVTKRATPTLSYTDGGVGSFPAGAPTAYTATTTEAACYKTCNSTGNSGYYFYSWTAAIEL